jgi:hypothetical protein
MLSSDLSGYYQYCPRAKSSHYTIQHYIIDDNIAYLAGGHARHHYQYVVTQRLVLGTS